MGRHYGMETSSSITYKETENYRVWLEELNDQPFIHVTIHNFSKAILKEIKEAWGEIIIQAYFEGYEQLFAYTQDNRIIKMIGGAEKIGEHGSWEVWKWEFN